LTYSHTKDQNRVVGVRAMRASSMSRSASFSASAPCCSISRSAARYTQILEPLQREWAALWPLACL